MKQPPPFRSPLLSMAIKLFYISACIFALRGAAFSLYPTINPDALAKSFGISIDCLDALNETLPCDQTLFQMSNTVDSYLWTTENLTDLCTPMCMASTSKWWSDVQGKCATDNIAAYGKMIPAETIAGRFFDDLSIACLQPSTGSNGSAPTSSAAASNNTSFSTGAAPYSNSSSAPNTTLSEPSWCLIESQEWIGSDIIRPDCSTNSTDPSCHDSADMSPENERIANLYPDDMVSRSNIGENRVIFQTTSNSMCLGILTPFSALQRLLHKDVSSKNVITVLTRLRLFGLSRSPVSRHT